MATNLDHIIQMIRTLGKVEEEGGAAAITNSIGGGQIAGSIQAGDDPPVKKKRKPTPVGRYGSRRAWLQDLRKDGK